MNEYTRPPLTSLACVHPACELFGQTGQGNLTIRKVYGRDGIRYLRCRVCQSVQVRFRHGSRKRAQDVLCRLVSHQSYAQTAAS